jgi:hypothetical protein
MMATVPSGGIPAGMRRKALDAIEMILKERPAMVGDMKEGDWGKLREAFLKWIDEEKDEPEHAEDDTGAIERLQSGLPQKSGAHDRMALDRSVRSFDEDGRMRVAVTNISKANICPYKGAEIPGWNEEEGVHLLGLDPEKTYMMLRDPEELRKSVKTWNGIQLLLIHKPVDAETDHGKEEIVGTTGTNADFVDPYLRNSLVLWTKDGIELIESEDQREISCGYHYDPDMTPGTFNGEHYDGVMRNIRGNHVALVEEGRAGPDVLVADTVAMLQWAAIEDELKKAWAA